jgi:hypothetical protein
MVAKRIVAMTAAATVAGCLHPLDDPPGAGETMLAGSTTVTEAVAAPVSVNVTGQVVGTDGTALAGVPVLRLGLDPYLEPILRTQTDAAGYFTLDGVEGNAREWFFFELSGGYAGVYAALDTTGYEQQEVPSTMPPTNAALASIARGFGITLDSTAAIVRVPIVTATGSPAAALVGGEIQVTFDPPLGVSVVSVSGVATAFNVGASDQYTVTVTRSGALCVPAFHPELVDSDGSVPIGTFVGVVTVAPTMACP